MEGGREEGRRREVGWGEGGREGGREEGERREVGWREGGKKGKERGRMAGGREGRRGKES